MGILWLIRQFHKCGLAGLLYAQFGLVALSGCSQQTAVEVAEAPMTADPPRPYTPPPCATSGLPSPWLYDPEHLYFVRQSNKQGYFSNVRQEMTVPGRVIVFIYPCVKDETCYGNQTARLPDVPVNTKPSVDFVTGELGEVFGFGRCRPEFMGESSFDYCWGMALAHDKKVRVKSKLYHVDSKQESRAVVTDMVALADAISRNCAGAPT